MLARRCPGGSLNPPDADTADDVVQLGEGGSVVSLGRAATAVAASTNGLAALVSECGTAGAELDGCGDGGTDLNADGDGLLTDVEVTEPSDQSHAVELARPLLEAADQHHFTVVSKKVFLRCRRRIGNLVRRSLLSSFGWGFRHPASPG